MTGAVLWQCVCRGLKAMSIAIAKMQKCQLQLQNATEGFGAAVVVVLFLGGWDQCTLPGEVGHALTPQPRASL